MKTKPALNLAAIQPSLRMADFEHNLAVTVRLYHEAVARGADIVVGPELGLFDYPAHDLYVREDLRTQHDDVYRRLCAEIGPVPYVTSVPRKNEHRGKPLHNMAVVIQNGREVFAQAKVCLADQHEYAEWRHFEPNTQGVRPFSLVLRNVRYTLGLLVCEDLWSGMPGGSGALHHRTPVVELARAHYALDALLVVNASAYWWGKRVVRRELVAHVARLLRCPVVYVNKVGGQDDLVFDGGSLIVDASGAVVGAGAHCKEGVVLRGDGDLSYDDASIAYLYEALVSGVRDYVGKNGFRDAVLGLSGGIDSALTLAIAVDALGAEHVRAYMMPSGYTSRESLEDAEACATMCGVQYESIPIGVGMDAFRRMLEEQFAGTEPDVTEENIQARLRGMLLMALSNKTGAIVLSTGNKSEMAVGYATLYGDMAGGFAVLKDVYKTQVFALALYRNALGRVMPERVIEKPPSAELRPDQKDTDSLPPYEVLDPIVKAYTEEYRTPKEIIAMGYDATVVHRVVRMIDRNEYKRRQAPPGTKVRRRGLSPEGGRVVPITVYNR